MFRMDVLLALAGVFAIVISMAAAIMAIRFANRHDDATIWSTTAFLVHEIGALVLAYMVTDTPNWPFAALIGMPAYALAFTLTIAAFLLNKRHNTARPVLT